MESDNIHQNSSEGTTTAPPENAPQEQSIAPFVLGLCSILCPLVIPGIGLVIGLICGITGVVMANRAKQTVRLDGLGQAGFIMSIVGTALCGLVVVVLLITLIVGLSAFGSLIGSAIHPYWAWF